MKSLHHTLITKGLNSRVRYVHAFFRNAIRYEAPVKSAVQDIVHDFIRGRRLKRRFPCDKMEEEHTQRPPVDGLIVIRPDNSFWSCIADITNKGISEAVVIEEDRVSDQT
jgi:hypothetical protein